MLTAKLLLQLYWCFPHSIPHRHIPVVARYTLINPCQAFLTEFVVVHSSCYSISSNSGRRTKQISWSTLDHAPAISAMAIDSVWLWQRSDEPALHRTLWVMPDGKEDLNVLLTRWLCKMALLNEAGNTVVKKKKKNKRKKKETCSNSAKALAESLFSSTQSTYTPASLFLTTFWWRLPWPFLKSNGKKKTITNHYMPDKQR